MRRLTRVVVSMAWLAGVVAAPGALAVTITDTAITTSPPTLVINGSGFDGGTAVVMLGQFAPLTVVTQSATQVAALLPAGIPLQGTYLVAYQLNGIGSGGRGPPILGYDEAWVTLGTIGGPGPPGPPGPVGLQGPT